MVFPNGHDNCVNVEATAPVGRPRKTWQNTASADIILCLLKVDPQVVHDRVKWRAINPLAGRLI